MASEQDGQSFGVWNGHGSGRRDEAHEVRPRHDFRKLDGRMIIIILQ